MLKIKKEKLKELEKFGFAREYDKDLRRYTEYSKEVNGTQITISYENIIYLYSNDKDRIFKLEQMCLDYELETLYDLIKADMVVKTNE